MEIVCAGWIKGYRLGSIIKRYLTSKQASVALRPFYFAVHPDRFHNPLIKNSNEKALQEFNGYLNDICSPKYLSPKPIKIMFYITDKNNNRNQKYRKISLELTGNDIRSIIISTLQICDLSTDYIPPQNCFDGFEFRKNSFIKINLKSSLLKCRRKAIDTRSFHKRFVCALKDEMDILKRKYDINEISWCMEWSITHLRRNLVAFSRLMDNLPLNEAFIVKEILRGSILRFGRGSYICCDGGLQLGVNDVLEDWRKLCLSANSFCQQLNELKSIQKYITEFLGHANIMISNKIPLIETLHHLRFLNRQMLLYGENRKIATKSFKMVVIEIMSIYDELSISKNGHLLVPCNVNIDHLIKFLVENSCESQKRQNSFRYVVDEVNILCKQCIVELNIEDIDWNNDLNIYDIKKCLEKLKNVDDEVRALLNGLSILLSNNQSIYVMNDGKLSIPVDYI